MTSRRAFLLGSVSTLALAGVAVTVKVWPPVSSAMNKPITPLAAAFNNAVDQLDTPWYRLTDLPPGYEYRVDQISVVNHGPETISWARLENPFSWSDPPLAAEVEPV